MAKKTATADSVTKTQTQEESVVKVEETPTPKSASSKPKTMADLLKMVSYQVVVPKKGSVVSGVIVSKDKNTLKLDIGAKTEGVVADKEYEFALDYIENLQVGDKVEAVVLSTENDRGQVILSLKGAANDAKWQYFEEALKKDEVLEAKAVESNKGGLIVVVNGVRGFVPSSQFGRQYVGKVQKLKGKTFQVKAIEVDREKNRLIFSERHVSEAKQLAQKDQALSAVKEAGIYEGVVSGVMPFGLFVTVEVPTNPEHAVTKEESGVITTEQKDEIGYVEGLIHISEISWEKVNHPRDYHKVGDRVQVKVLGIDDKTGKLNLSIKQLQDDPWKKITENYQPGTTFTGTVTRIESFGVFVNVEPGVDGLIHATKLDPNRTLKVGEKVTVNVESVDAEQRRMSLSLVLVEVPMGYK